MTEPAGSTGQAQADPSQRITAYHWYVVGLLTLISAMQYLDRQVIAILIEPLKLEFDLSDSQIGFLVGASFAVPFAIAAIPLGVLADRHGYRRLVAAVLALWSGLTMICAAAGSYWHLVMARIGVGAAESPTKPAAVALISDLFPLRQRSTAIGVFWTGSSIGTVIAFVFGGYVAAELGWRMAFLIAGLPGLVLAVLLMATVREPARRGADDRIIAGESAPIPTRTILKFLVTQRALLLLYAAAIMVWTVGAGISTWMASFLIRVHGMDIRQAGLYFGVAHGMTAWIGSVLGGAVADFAARRDATMVARVSAIAALAGAVFVAGMLLSPSVPAMVAFVCLWSVVQAGAITPIVGLSQSLVKPRMRATTMAAFLMLSNLFAVAVGPQIIGTMSDVFAPWAGTEAIRYSMLLLMLFDVAAAGLLVASTRTLARDIESAARTEPDAPAAG